MYVTVRRSKHFGGTDEIARRARDGLVPTLKTLPGFVSYDILSLEDNVVMGITIFDNKASAEEANKSFVLRLRVARRDHRRWLCQGHSCRPRFHSNHPQGRSRCARAGCARLHHQSPPADPPPHPSPPPQYI